jgi:hypothetical protein
MSAQHDDILNEAKKQIGSCFSVGNYIFAAQPDDIKRAQQLCDYGTQNNLTLQEMENIAIDYLKTQNCTDDHIDEQRAEIRLFLRKTLS